MTRRKQNVLAALLALPLTGLAAIALAQPANQPGNQPPAKGDRPMRERGPQGMPGNEHVEKYRDALRDHPRIARALVALNTAKDHLNNAGHDFGGNKATAVAACDNAIKQLTEAMKFDQKVERPQRPEGAPEGGDRPRRNRGGQDADRSN